MFGQVICQYPVRLMTQHGAIAVLGAASADNNYHRVFSPAIRPGKCSAIMQALIGIVVFYIFTVITKRRFWCLRPYFIGGQTCFVGIAHAFKVEREFAAALAVSACYSVFPIPSTLIAAFDDGYSDHQAILF